MSNWSGELPQSCLADLVNVSELDASLDAKGTFDPGDGLYPRDGTDEVSRIEALLTDVTIPDRRRTIAWASGMSAVSQTVNFAALHMADHPRDGGRPVIAYAQHLYSQSSAFFQNERRKGVRTISFDSGDDEYVAEMIFDKGADVLFAETVANTPEMPVLDIESLLTRVRGLDNPPIVILDNTLPLKTGIDFANILGPQDKVIIVESGTKNLMNNSELLGIAYGPNVELMDGLRRHKAHSGAVNSLGGLATIAAKLEATIPGFHARNQEVFSSTGLIARALQEAALELGSAADFETTFPGLRGHSNYEIATKMTAASGEHDFASPVVFITATDLEAGASNLIHRLAKHPAMREQIKEGQIYLGQSFGLPRARLLYDRSAPNVRFAGGYDLDDAQALADAIKEAAADK